MRVSRGHTWPGLERPREREAGSLCARMLQQCAACLPCSDGVLAEPAPTPPHPPQNCEMRTVVLSDGGGAGTPDVTWFRGGEAYAGARGGADVGDCGRRRAGAGAGPDQLGQPGADPCLRPRTLLPQSRRRQCCQTSSARAAARCWRRCKRLGRAAGAKTTARAASTRAMQLRPWRRHGGAAALVTSNRTPDYLPLFLHVSLLTFSACLL